MSKTPSEVAGPVEHWDPDDISGSDGDLVSSWTGKNGLTFTAATGQEPELADSTRQPSGHQMVQMSKSSASKRMTCSASALNAGTVTYIFTVLPMVLTHTWLFNKANTSPATIAVRAGAGNAYEAGMRLDGSEGTFRTATASAHQQHAKPQVLTVRYDGATLILRVNGEEVASNAVAGTIDVDSPGPLVLGNHPSSNAPSNALFGDFAVYGEAIADVDVADVEDWMMERWSVADYFDDWVTLPVTSRASPAAGESDIFSPCIREPDASTWIMFAATRETSTNAFRWIDYWTSPKSDPHNWTRNSGTPIVDADDHAMSTCRAVSAVKDGSTWHLLVDSTGSFYHFTGTDLGSLTNNGEVFTGDPGSGWDGAVRHPNIVTEKVGDAWAVYYDGRSGGTASGFGAIGVAFTEDFATFTDRQMVLDVSPLWWEATDVGAPSVRKNGNRWEMLYLGFNDDFTTGLFEHFIGAAYSFDGVTFTRASQFPVITSVRDGNTDVQIGGPEWFHDGTDLHIYASDGDPTAGVYSTEPGVALIAALDVAASRLTAAGGSLAAVGGVLTAR